MLDSHEFRRDGLDDDVLDCPVKVAVFSVELLLPKLGRCGIGMGFGEFVGASFDCEPLPFCTEDICSVDCVGE
jgi:hypothetical protein